MSPRAACLLEYFGFEYVYHYVAGKADWKAAGLALEGAAEHGLTVGDATRPDVPTAELHEVLDLVRQRVTSAGWDEAIVIDRGRVVVGRLRGAVWDGDGTARVDQVMESGPTTVRPDGSLSALLARMNDRGTQLVVVTDPQGVLIGVMLAEDSARLVAGESPEQVWQDCDGCPGRWVARAIDGS